MAALAHEIRPARGRLAARCVFWGIAVFYAYGALVHVLNMASLTGFPWPEAPPKWQALDVIYLILDVTVVIGLFRGAWIGIAAFFAAALSQIALYTLFRGWVLDVPEPFRRGPEDMAYLDGLVIFHLVTCLLMTVALLLARHDRAATNGQSMSASRLTSTRAP